MWIKASGEIAENTLQVTTAVSSHIIVTGEKKALIDCSIFAMKNNLVENIKYYVDSLDYIFLTKSCFDHVGALPALKKIFPGVEIIGGVQSSDLLKDKKFRTDIYNQNKLACESLGEEFDFSLEEYIDLLTIDNVLSDGEIFSLGNNLDLKLIDSPGNSIDSVSYYIKSDLVLCAGDSIGSYGGRGIITPNYRYDYVKYQESIDKLSEFEIEVLSFSHNGCLAGELVTPYFRELASSANFYKQVFAKRLESGESVDDIARSVQIEWNVEGRFPEGPFKDLMFESIKDMILASR